MVWLLPSLHALRGSNKYPYSPTDGYWKFLAGAGEGGGGGVLKAKLSEESVKLK